MTHCTARPSPDRARVRERRLAPILDRSPVLEGETCCRTSKKSWNNAAHAHSPAGHKGVAILVVSVAVALSFLVLSVDYLPDARQAHSQSYTVRAPIIITGDGGFTSANGVVRGTGAASDPYVISGWEIRVASGSGISISNTAAHFIISEVHVNSTASASGVQYAVYLYNVSNGQVKNSLLNNTPKGIHGERASSCSVNHNTIRACSQKAVELATCDRFNVVGNNITAANGVMATTISNSSVSANAVANAEVAIGLVDASDIVVQQNRMVQCFYMVSVSGGASIVITDNNSTHGFYAVQLYTCKDSVVSGNELTWQSGAGLYTAGDITNVTFVYNQVRYSQYSGYMVDGADGVTVRENLFENNTIIFGYSGGGVTITSGSNMSFYNNNFITNTLVQAQDPFGPENRWNASYPTGGNYWTDYTGSDEMVGPLQDFPGHDGIGDTDYAIDLDSLDHYPLMARHYINNNPVASFTATPSSGVTGTVVQLDGSGSYDPDSSTGDSVSEYRWDFDGDGAWDTGKSSQSSSDHQYLLPGNYTAMLEVTDSHGLTSIFQVSITITGTAIPEFGTVMLPVAGLLAVVGCASMFSRRKQGRA